MSYNFNEQFPRDDPIWQWSDPTIVNSRAKNFYHTNVYRSLKSNKKYRMWNPIKQKWIDFGQMYYEDFSHHKNLERRYNYLRRSSGIRGDWRDDIYSPNNLSRTLLWWLKLNKPHMLVWVWFGLNRKDRSLGFVQLIDVPIILRICLE